MPKKQKNLTPVLQQLALNKLMEEFQSLLEYIASTSIDEQIIKSIKEILDELENFKEVLRKNKEYTEDQVTELVQLINQFTHEITHKGSPQNLQEILIKALAPLNRGKNPFTQIDIQYQLEPEFPKQMAAIKKHCEKLNLQLERVKTQSKGLHYTPIEKLISACEKAKSAITTWFKIGMSIAKEVKYYAKQAVIASGLKERTPEDKKEKWEHKQKAAQASEKYAKTKIQQAEAEQRGMETLRQQKENGGKPRILKNK